MNTRYRSPFGRLLTTAAAVFLMAALVAPGAALAQVCYTVSDHPVGGDGADGDELFSFNLSGGAATSLGDPGTALTEAIQLVSSRDKLYYADGTEILQASTANPDVLSSCGTVGGATDLDGLAYDAVNNVFYASDRLGDPGEGSNGQPEDLLHTLTIDAATCALSVVRTVTVPAVAELYDVDDVAVDPVGGGVFVVINNANATDSYLAQINPVTGAIINSNAITIGGNPLNDVEGATFAPDGTMLVTTGESAGLAPLDPGVGPLSNLVLTVNIANGEATQFLQTDGRQAGDRTDFESITCGQPEPVTPPDVVCWVTSDHPVGGDGGDADEVFVLDLSAGTATNIGNPGSNLTEAMDYVTCRDKVYYANGTEILVAPGNDPTNTTSCGTVTGASDLDGLSYDVANDVFYASDRLGDPGEGSNGQPEDLLHTLKIDDATCAIEVVKTVTIPAVAGLFDVDDVAVDPANGDVYVVINNSNATDSFLAEVDPMTGAILSSTAISVGATPLNDVEGLAFAPDGTLLATTGESAGLAPGTPGVGPFSNLVFSVDPADGSAASILQIDGRDPGDRTDFEAITCGQPKLKLGDTLWADTDNSGTQDGGENGIAGVTIELFVDKDGDGVAETLAGTTTTGADGMYMFSNLAPGDYKVKIPASELADGGNLDGYTSSTGNGENVDPDDNVDGDDNGDLEDDGSICSELITLSLGDEPNDNPEQPGADNNYNPTLDLGVVPTAGLGDTIFCDEDGDGVYTPGTDTPVEGVIVELFEDTNGNGVADPGEKIREDVTDANGEYGFDGLLAGDYIVVVPASEFEAGEPLEGKASVPGAPDPDNNTDNDDNGAPQADGSVATPPITIAPGEENGDGDDDPDFNPSVDLGFEDPSLSLGDTIFCDEDGDGIYTAGTDTPVEGVVVQLFEDANGNGLPDPGEEVAEDVTGAEGTYSFGGLDPGDYIVVIPASEFEAGEPLEGKASVPGAPDPDNNTDNDDNGAPLGDGSVATPPITLGTGEETDDGDDDPNNNPSVDLGFENPGLSLGNQVWCDTDLNGLQDGNEPLIADVEVQLYQDADMDGIPDNPIPLATDVTDEFGFYEFTGLDAGKYIVLIPASASAQGGPLVDKVPTLDPVADPNTDVDGDNNANLYPLQALTYVSGTVELSAGDEPAGDGDPNSNETVDFGFRLASALPIELASFTAVAGEDLSVELQWTTLTEVDNAGFSIEAKSDGQFEELAWIDGQGNSSVEVTYDHRLTNLATGTYTFRLKQVDFDGTTSYSPQVEVEVDLPGDYMIGAAYPNPFNPQTSISFTVKETQEVRVALYDLSGRLVRELWTGTATAKESETLRIDGAGLSSGTYLVRLEARAFTGSRSITLLK